MVGRHVGRARTGDEEGDKYKTTPFKLEVATLTEDSTGAISIGGAFGLAVHRPGSDEWWWYSGEDATDEASEWRAFDPRVASTLPADADVFLPPVTAVLRAADGALWIGTEQGLARYVARGEGGPVAFRTLLEAFPDLCPGAVSSLVQDERGFLWGCTDRGLLRFDGRDFFQFRAAGRFVQLGRADSLYPGGAEAIERGAWRFRRAGEVWERFDTTLTAPTWAPFGGPVRTTEEPAVNALAFTDGLTADIVDEWSPDDFTVSGSTPVDPARFVMRVKLDGDTRVVDGGIPAVPRLPAGTSEWRYLSLEPDERSSPRAARRGRSRAACYRRRSPRPTRSLAATTSGSPTHWTRRASTTRRCSRSLRRRTSASRGSRSGRSRCSSGSAGAGRATRSIRPRSTGCSAACSRCGPLGSVQSSPLAKSVFERRTEMTFVEQFGGKSAGELIRAELWNNLMTALDTFSTSVDSRFTPSTSLAALTGQVATLSGAVEEMETELGAIKTVLAQYYKVSLSTTRVSYATGEEATITATVQDLQGRPIAFAPGERPGSTSSRSGATSARPPGSSRRPETAREASARCPSARTRPAWRRRSSAPRSGRICRSRPTPTSRRR